MQKLTSLFIISMLLMSWKAGDGAFGSAYRLEKLGTPNRITYHPTWIYNGIAAVDSAAFAITDKRELVQAMTEICGAGNPSTWKGAGWDEVRIYYADTMVRLHTNQSVIGAPCASGLFYRLPKKNFITRRGN